MHDIKAEDIKTVEWHEDPTTGKLGSVIIGYKNGERKKYEGHDLAWVVPQIKDSFPSSRPNLLSDTY
jgi:hypothetical protein